MFKEGIFAKYESPAAKDFHQGIHRSQSWAALPQCGHRRRLQQVVLKPADAPKSLEDLVKPQYSGKIVMPDPTQHTTTTQWVASLDKLMGKEKADKFVRDLAAQKPILVESLLPAAERVATGETPDRHHLCQVCFIFGQQRRTVGLCQDWEIHG